MVTSVVSALKFYNDVRVGDQIEVFNGEVKRTLD